MEPSQYCCREKIGVGEDGHIPGHVQVLARPPSVGSWLHTGKNSRVSHSKVKEGLFREINTPQTECGPSQKARGHGRNTRRRVWAISEGKSGARVRGGQFL